MPENGLRFYYVYFTGIMCSTHKLKFAFVHENLNKAKTPIRLPKCPPSPSNQTWSCDNWRLFFTLFLGYIIFKIHSDFEQESPRATCRLIQFLRSDSRSPTPSPIQLKQLTPVTEGLGRSVQDVDPLSIDGYSFRPQGGYHTPTSSGPVKA